MRLVVLENRLKMYHAKFGYNRVFGLDIDERKRMSHDEQVARFDLIWETSLQHAVQSAERCGLEDAQRKLPEEQQRYVREDQEHREFWLEDGLFIAQVNQRAQPDPELTQLWFVRSSNVDPRTLFVTFETVEIRRLFDKVAFKLGWKPEALGEKILLDFIESIERRPIQRRDSNSS